MANGLIPKPTLWAFSFFANLKGTCVFRDEHAVVVRREDGGYEAVLWNLCGDEKDSVTLDLTFPLDSDAAALIDLVDEEICNPLACWHRMGEPADLTAEQLEFLRAAGQPAKKVLIPEKTKQGQRISLTLSPNALLRLRMVPVIPSSDKGYDYSWYCPD